MKKTFFSFLSFFCFVLFCQAQTIRTLNYTTIGSTEAGVIQDHLNNGDPVVVTSGTDITVNANITVTSANSASLTFKAPGNIFVEPNRSISTNGGAVIFWSDSDNNGVGGIQFKNSSTTGASVTTNGGAIIMGGGTDPLTDFAIANSGTFIIDAQPRGGLWLRYASLNAGGGNITLNGSNGSLVASTRGLYAAESIIQTSGSGTITLNGDGGSSTGATNPWGINTAVTTIQTFSGDIRIYGISNRTNAGNERGVALGGFIQSVSGDIYIEDRTTSATQSNYNARFNGISMPVSIGKGNLASSSSNVYIKSNEIETTSASSVINTTGIVEVTPFTGQPIFTNTLNWNATTTASRITIGGSTNTADITINAVQTSSGMVTVYGGNLTVAENINTSAGNANGDILLKARGNILLNASKTIISNGGDVIFWADSDASGTTSTAGGAIALLNASSISTGGGNIILAGGNDANSDGAPDGYAIGAYSMTARGLSPATAGLCLDNASLNAGAGNIIMRGQGTGNLQNFQIGTRLYGGAITAKDITIEAIGSIQGPSSSSWGLSLEGFSITGSGNILLNGQGGRAGQPNTDVNQAGIEIRPAIDNLSKHSEIKTTGSGNITIVGFGGSGINSDLLAQDPQNSGIRIQPGQTNPISSVSGNITLEGTSGYSGRGSAIIIGSPISSTNGNIILKGNRSVSGTLNLNGNIQINGSVTTGANLSIETSGSVTQTAAITVAGPVTVYGNAIALNANLTTTSTSSGNILLQGTELTGFGSITVASGRNATISTSGNSTFGGVVSGTSSSIIKQGAGTLMLSGANSYTGTTTVNGGTLQLNKTGGATIPSTNNLIISEGTLKVSFNQVLNDLTVSSGTLEIDNDVVLTNDGVFTCGGIITNNGTIVIKGSSSFPGSNSTINAMNNLTIDRSAGVILNKDISVTGTLTLLSGVLDAETSSLTVAGAISGSSSSSYIKTSSTGVLKMPLSNGTNKTFPVGNSSYNPVTITNNTGSSDDFSVRVSDAVLDGGIIGNPITNKVVNRTWHIGKTNANAGSGIDMTFVWDVSQEGINMTHYKLSHYGTFWAPAVGTSGIVSGTTTKTMTHTGYTGNFSTFTIGSFSSLLPVTWHSFTAEKQGAQALLKWSTASEQNTKNFEVQHSTNTQSWTKLGTVAAAGSSTTTHQYSFTHSTPLKGGVYNYYRILQRDLDDNFSYSKIVGLTFTKPASSVDVYPNPASETVTVYLTVSQEVRLINAAGSTIWRGTLSAGHNQVNLTGVTKGMYWIVAGNVKKQLLVH